MPTKTIALFGATQDGNVGKELLNSLKTTFRYQVERGDFEFLIFTREVVSKEEEGEDEDFHRRFHIVPLPMISTTSYKNKDDKGPNQQPYLKTDTDALAEILTTHNVETCFICVPQLLVYCAKEFVQDNLLPAFVKSKNVVKHIVKVGTGNAEHYEYGHCHIAAEEAIHQAGFNLTVLQGGDYSTNPPWLGPSPPGAPYAFIDFFKALSYLSYMGGPLGMFRSMGNIPSFFGPGTLKLPFLHMADFTDSIASCLLNNNDGNKATTTPEIKVYKIYSEEVSLEDVARVYGNMLGRKIHVLEMTEEETRELMAMGGWRDEMNDIAIEMFARFRDGVFQADESWDGFQKLCPGKETRTFQDFAKRNVDAGMKPIKLW